MCFVFQNGRWSSGVYLFVITCSVSVYLVRGKLRGGLCIPIQCITNALVFLILQTSFLSLWRYCSSCFWMSAFAYLVHISSFSHTVFTLLLQTTRQPSFPRVPRRQIKWAAVLRIRTCIQTRLPPTSYAHTSKTTRTLPQPDPIKATPSASSEPPNYRPPARHHGPTTTPLPGSSSTLALP
jgi:hypothetical protein